MKFTSLIIAVVVLGSIAWGQATVKTQVQNAPCMPPGMAGMHGNVMYHTEHSPEKWWKDSDVVKQINITDSQAQQIEQGFYDHRLRIIDLLGESEKQEVKLQQFMDAEQPDEAQINSQVEQVVTARAALENQGACGVSKLMHCHPQPGRLINPLRDLAAQQDVAFGTSVLPREQPVIVPAAQQRRPEIVNVFVNQSGEVPFQRIFQLDPVLDVVTGEDEPVVRVRPAGLDQVDPELDGHQIGQAYRRHR